MLHDTIEDTQTTADELQVAFGDEIADIVQKLTDDKSLEKSVRKQRQVELASTKSHKARCVKIADKTSNLRDLFAHPPADWSDDRRNEYCRWARNVVDQMRGTHHQLEQLFDQAYDMVSSAR
jgi:GTP diphosphokinase / guanosine-3',5'-bis(diphosphate) 3'-diphosphatase